MEGSIKTYMRKIIVTTISWMAVALWMLLIFRLSSQVAVKSNGMSMGITDFIINIFNKLFHSEISGSGSLNHIVRKTAHFMAYLILGILSFNALKISCMGSWRRPAFSLGLCVLYAISDELHQVFVSGRSGQASDVFIDSLGAGIGIAIFLLAVSFHESRQHKNQ